MHCRTARNGPRNRMIAGQAMAIVLLFGITLFLAGCSSESKKARHLARARKSFEAGQYDATLVACMNVLQLDRLNPEAIRYAALAQSKQGRYRQAFPFLVKARELLPEDLDIRLTLATLYKAGGKPEKAREEALGILNLSATNIPAFLILVDTITTSNQIAETRALLQTQDDALGDLPIYHIALGNLSIHQGEPDQAKEAFLQARTLDPDFHPASLALAALYSITDQPEEAAHEYQNALQQAPDNAFARMKWADFELRRGNYDTTRQILEDADGDVADDPLILFTKARLEFTQRNLDPCIQFVDEVLNAVPNHADASFLKANALVIRREPDAAIAIYNELLERNANSIMVRFRLAVARLAKNDVREAMRELERVIDKAPGFIDAVTLLAELQIRTGNPADATPALERLVQHDTAPPKAHLLLATAYHAAARYAEAEAVCRNAIKNAPDDIRFQYLLGRVLTSSNRPEEARDAFAAALKQAPRFSPALSRLVLLDLQAGNVDDAVARLTTHIEAHPDDASAVLLLGKTYFLTRQPAQAEQHLLKAIELEPRLVGAYTLLGRIYAGTARIDEALAKIEEARSVNPDNPSTLMLAGILYQQEGNQEKAIECYERILAARPGFPAAANNLAYLYANDPTQLDRAYELARNAHERTPDNPYLADTFGWILYLRGETKWALSVLRKTEEALAGVPEANYHLGMAHFALGHEQEALAALQQAVAAEEDFQGLDTARRSVEALNIRDSGLSPAEAIQKLDTIIEQEPDNLPAIATRARILAQTGRTEQALAAYENAMDLSDAFTPAWIGIARLRVSQHGQLKQAAEAAAKAKELAPDDPDVTGLLGWISFLQGNHEWALGLLRESAAKRPDDAQGLYRLGRAHYAMGDVPAAKQNILNAIASDTAFAERDQAKQFLAMLDYHVRGAELDALPADVRTALDENPDDVPALMVAATVHHRNGQRKEAIQQYKRILAIYPAFAPAQARLAELYATDAGTVDKAYDLATQARTVLSDDPILAKTLGILAFKRDNHDYAVTLLQECVKKTPNDGEAHFYLGMCYDQLGRTREATQALTRALEIAPQADYAQQADEMLTKLKTQHGD